MFNRRQFQQAGLAAIVGNGLLLPNFRRQKKEEAQEESEWSQWGGPRRDFRVAGLGKDQPLPKPTLLWQRKLGSGHSAIVTKGDFGYSLHLDGDEEVLEKWRLDDGKQVWNRRYEVGYHASTAQYDGPHSTPVIHQDRIITASIDAKIRAVNASDGSVLWQRDLRNDYGTKLPQSGYASSPIVWDDQVVVPTLGESTPQETENFVLKPKVPEGRKVIPGAVSFDLETGKQRWKTKTFRSSHGSPIAIEHNDQPMLVFHGMFELLGVNPRNGSILWRQLLRRAAADNVSFTPIWDKQRNQFLISHGYCNRGAQAIKLEGNTGRWRTSLNWSNSRMQIVHTNAVLMDNVLIGTNRSSATLMVAIDVQNGQTIFRKRGFGKSNFVGVGSQLIILDEGGDLVCGRLENEDFVERWRIPVLSKGAWTVPAFSDKRVMVRDGRDLKVYSLSD